MRPVQAVLLTLTLAALVGLIWWLTRLDGETPRTAEPVAVAVAAPAGAGADSGTLAAPEVPAGADRGPGEERTTALTDAPTDAVADLPLPASELPSRERTGTVVDANDRPVAGAEVLFASAGNGFTSTLPLDVLFDSGERFGNVRRAETDAEGRYRLELPDWNPVRVAVRASGFAPHDAERAPAPRGEDEPPIRLQPSVLVEGRVVDHLGRPVEGALVRSMPVRTGGLLVHIATPEGDEEPRGWRTDAAGRFVVDRLAAGPYRLRAEHADAPPEEVSGQCAEVGGRVTGVEIRLAEGTSIEGRVEGLDAERFDDFVVHARPAGGMSVDGAPFQTKTAGIERDGRFRVTGLRKGVNVELGLYERGEDDGFWGNGEADALSALAGDRDVVLRFRGAAAVRLRVVDATTGAPIEDYEVAAGGWWAESLTDDDGALLTHHEGGVAVIPDVDTRDGGTFQLTVRAKGYAPHESSDLVATPGEVLDLGDVRLFAVPEIVVHVTDAATGDPVRGARVELVLEPESSGNDFALHVSGPSTNDLEDLTDEDGVAELPSRPGRMARVTVTHKEYAEGRSAPQSLSDAPGHRVDVALTRGGDVVVTVLGADGAPIAGRDVELHREDGEPHFGPFGQGSHTRETDANGRVRFARLAAGPQSFRLAPRSRGGDAVFVSSMLSGGTEPLSEEWRTVVVQEGGEHEVTLHAEPSARLTGRVLENGRPLAGARLKLSEADGGSDAGVFFDGFGGEGGVRTDADGRFEFDDEAVGEMRLEVEHPMRAMPARYELELDPGDNEVELDLDVSVVRGRVVDPDGRPVVGAAIQAHRVESGSARRSEFVMISTGGATFTAGGGVGDPVRTDADGRYELRGVAAGVQLRLACDPSGPYLEDAELVVDALDPGEEREVERLELDGGGALRVTVRSAGATPLEFCNVTIRRTDDDGDEESESRFQQGEGAVLFEGVAKGAWTVTVESHTPSSSGPVRGEPREAEVRANEVTEVEVVLP